MSGGKYFVSLCVEEGEIKKEEGGEMERQRREKGKRGDKGTSHCCSLFFIFLIVDACVYEHWQFCVFVCLLVSKTRRGIVFSNSIINLTICNGTDGRWHQKSKASVIIEVDDVNHNASTSTSLLTPISSQQINVHPFSSHSHLL